MMTKSVQESERDLFRPLLSDLINMGHPLVVLAGKIDWAGLEADFAGCYCRDNGRPGVTVRMMAGLTYLKYAFNMSDEATLAEWVENPYWQYFTGGKFFSHEKPVDASNMGRWRRRIGKDGAGKIMALTVSTGRKAGFIKKGDTATVNVDTTVQEKNVRFPTDARSCDRARERLVEEAKNAGITLRQSYGRCSRRALHCHSGYAKAKQTRRAGRELKRIRAFLGRVARDIWRKTAGKPSGKLAGLLSVAWKLLEQRKDSKDKVYSVHEPGVECIGKGKAHKRYEFGNKVSIATTSKGNWVIGALSFHGNPYDGRTLRPALEQLRELHGITPQTVVVDMGYRKHGCDDLADIQIVNRFRKDKKKRAVYSKWKRRSAIEPVIGHLKSDCRLGRNWLKGEIGDDINVMLSAAGHNIRKLLRACADFFALFWLWRCLQVISSPARHPAAAYAYAG